MEGVSRRRPAPGITADRSDARSAVVHLSGVVVRRVRLPFSAEVRFRGDPELSRRRRRRRGAFRILEDAIQRGLAVLTSVRRAGHGTGCRATRLVATRLPAAQLVRARGPDEYPLRTLYRGATRRIPTPCRCVPGWERLDASPDDAPCLPSESVGTSRTRFAWPKPVNARREPALWRILDSTTPLGERACGLLRRARHGRVGIVGLKGSRCLVYVTLCARQHES